MAPADVAQSRSPTCGYVCVYICTRIRVLGSQKDICAGLGSFPGTYSHPESSLYPRLPVISASLPTQLSSTPQLSLVGVEASGPLPQPGGGQGSSVKLSSWMASIVVWLTYMSYTHILFTHTPKICPPAPRAPHPRPKHKEHLPYPGMKLVPPPHPHPGCSLLELPKSKPLLPSGLFQVAPHPAVAEGRGRVKGRPFEKGQKTQSTKGRGWDEQ